MFWNQYKEYIITLTLLTFGIVLVVFGIVPLQKHIHDVTEQHEALLEDKHMQEVSMTSLDTVHSQRQLVKDESDRLRVVIKKSDIVVLIQNIEAIAVETSNEIKIDAKELPPPPKNKPKSEAPIASNNPNKKAEEEKEKKEKPVEKKLLEMLGGDQNVLISISVTGKYEDILHFLKKVETMPYATDVLSLKIQVDAQDERGQNDSNIFSIAANGDANLVKKAPVISTTDLPLVATFETIVYVIE